jgi:hypothetical protein
MEIVQANSSQFQQLPTPVLFFGFFEKNGGASSKATQSQLSQRQTAAITCPVERLAGLSIGPPAHAVQFSLGGRDGDDIRCNVVAARGPLLFRP